MLSKYATHDSLNYKITVLMDKGPENYDIESIKHVSVKDAIESYHEWLSLAVKTILVSDKFGKLQSSEPVNM